MSLVSTPSRSLRACGTGPGAFIVYLIQARNEKAKLLAQSFYLLLLRPAFFRFRGIFFAASGTFQSSVRALEDEHFCHVGGAYSGFQRRHGLRQPRLSLTTKKKTLHFPPGRLDGAKSGRKHCVHRTTSSLCCAFSAKYSQACQLQRSLKSGLLNCQGPWGLRRYFCLGH